MCQSGEGVKPVLKTGAFFVHCNFHRSFFKEIIQTLIEINFRVSNNSFLYFKVKLKGVILIAAVHFKVNLSWCLRLEGTFKLRASTVVATKFKLVESVSLQKKFSLSVTGPAMTTAGKSRSEQIQFKRGWNISQCLHRKHHVKKQPEKYSILSYCIFQKRLRELAKREQLILKISSCLV